MKRIMIKGFERKVFEKWKAGFEDVGYMRRSRRRTSERRDRAKLLEKRIFCKIRYGGKIV